jgi:hypothetical protein
VSAPRSGIARCAGEPVSWLRLELHHQGALEGAERDQVALHLAECAACASCLAKIREDDAVALPPLPARPAADPRWTASAAERPRTRASAAERPRTRPRAWAAKATATVGALAAVGAAVFALRAGTREGARDETVPPSSAVYAKGTALSFSLVREDGARVDGDAGGYRDGERFKALVTCTPGAATYFDVVVYDEGGASFPLAPAADFACGNDVPLPGAFRLTGQGDAEVCLVWSESGAVDRAVVGVRSGPLDRRLCKRLTAAP